MGMVLFIVGLVLTILSLGGVIFLIKMVNKSKEEKDEIRYLKFLGAVSIVFGLGGAAMIPGIAQLTVTGFNESVSIITGGSYALMIIFGFLTFLSAITLLSTFIFNYYKINFVKEKLTRINKIVFVSSVFATILMFIVMMEGLAPYLAYPLPNTIILGGDKLAGTPKDTVSGGFQMALYAIAILSGAIFVYFLSDHRLYQTYGKHGMLESTFLVAFPSGIIGARLWYCYVLEFEQFSKWNWDWNASNNPFAIWNGGLAIMGGALLGIIAGVSWVMIRHKEIRIRLALDIIVPTILIAQAIGRWGNFFNLEIYSQATIPVENAWWMPSFVKYNMMAIDSPAFLGINATATQIHIPLFLVEFITNLCGYFFIRYLFEERYLFKGIAKLFGKDEKSKFIIENAFPVGGSAGMYLIWYGLTRVILEPLRYTTYEYSESITSAYVLIGLGFGVIALFAVFNYLIEPKMLKITTYENIQRLSVRKFELVEVTDKGDKKTKIKDTNSINDEVLEELKIEDTTTKETIKVVEKKKEKKEKSSINDDLDM